MNSESKCGKHEVKPQKRPKNSEFDPQELPEDDGQEEGTVPELDEDGLGVGSE